jgi:hypothetical protein
MKNLLLLIVSVLGPFINLSAQDYNNEKIVSEIIIDNIDAKLTINDGTDLFHITIKDEDHSCVADICGVCYSEEDKDFKQNIKVLRNNLVDIYHSIGNLKNCDIKKWENEGIKFTVYGIAPDIAYICIDGHGHGTISKDGVKKFYTWIDTLNDK